MRPHRRAASVVAAAVTLLALLTPLPAAHAAGSPNTITGTVTAPKIDIGRSISTECTFHLVSLAGAVPEYTFGSCGGFSLSNVPAGQYRLRVDVSSTDAVYADTWYGNTPFEHLAETITVGNDGASGINIELLPAGAISGTMSVPPGGASPAGDLTAVAYLFDPATGRSTAVSTATANAEGQYRLRELPTGDYTVEFADAGNPPRYSDAFLGGTRLIAEAERVHVQAGGTTEVGAGTPVTLVDSVSRIAGSDRFETSAAISRGFAPGVPVAYIANGLNWPDALSAGPAAAHLGGPLLLTRPDILPGAVAQELKRLTPARIVVVGGPSVVSDAQLRLLRDYAPVVDRVAGADRYATSRAVIADAFGASLPSRKLVVATGRAFPDALSGGALATRLQAPLLLVDGLALEMGEANRRLLGATIFDVMVVVGGPGAVTLDLERDLQKLTRYRVSTRYGGADRYATNRQVIDSYPSYPSHTASGVAVLANGTGFADALGGVVLAGRDRAPLVLSPADCIPAATLLAARKVRTDEWILLGSEGVLSRRVASLTAC